MREDDGLPALEGLVRERQMPDGERELLRVDGDGTREVSVLVHADVDRVVVDAEHLRDLEHVPARDRAEVAFAELRHDRFMARNIRKFGSRCQRRARR